MLSGKKIELILAGAYYRYGYDIKVIPLDSGPRDINYQIHGSKGPDDFFIIPVNVSWKITQMGTEVTFTQIVDKSEKKLVGYLILD